MALKKIQYDVQLLSTEKMLQAKTPAVYTNDLNSAEFVFNILDMTPEQLAGATATTLLYMRDGSFFQNSDVNLNSNTFTYLLKENEGNHGGLAQIQLVVKIGTIEYASQLYSFEVVTGLETKVAVEVMIHDWTTLTRDAQAYIAQFLLDEEGRKATFEANEQDRQLAFDGAEELRQQKETERQEAESGRIEAEQSRVDAEGTRQTTFTTNEATRHQRFDDAQTERTSIFTQSETDRATAFGESEALRQAGYDADHGRAETDHTTAVADHTTAVADHTTAVADHTIVQGFNTRLTAEETATANSKISAVKGKTFADVDARFEELETINSVIFDSTFNASFIAGAWTADIGTNALNCSVAHGLVVGDSVSFVDDTGTLPTGIVAEPEFYYVVAVPTTTSIQISLTRDGTAVTISEVGASGWKIRPASVTFSGVTLDFTKYREIDIYSPNLEFVPIASTGNSYLQVSLFPPKARILLDDKNVYGRISNALLYSVITYKKYVKLPLHINIIKIGPSLYKIRIDARGLQSSNYDMSSPTTVTRDFGGIVTGSEITSLSFYESYSSRVKNGTRVVVVRR